MSTWSSFLCYRFELCLTVILISSFLVLSFPGNFQEDFEVTFGGERARVLENGDELSLSLDQSSGSGFQSKNLYLFGRIDMKLKLVPGNSAGTVTTYYLKSEEKDWDEIDLEFLGNLTGDPYTLHTNVYTQGKGGREQQFRLWFDPTVDFHTYSILWNPQRIVFYVDAKPVREFKNMEANDLPFPKNQPMRVYGSLWNADDWATRGGSVKTDWTHAPFSASFRDFNADACVWSPDLSPCPSDHPSPWLGARLDRTEQQIMAEIQRKYMVYDYCTDPKREKEVNPLECNAQATVVP